MENGNGLTAEKMIEAIEKSKGFVSTAAQLLGCSRRHFYARMNQMPTVQQALEDMREKRHDFVESKLLKRIDAEDIAAIIFYLKTQCKSRGYVERQEITGADSGPLDIHVIYDAKPEQTG